MAVIGLQEDSAQGRMYDAQVKALETFCLRRYDSGGQAEGNVLSHGRDRGLRSQTGVEVSER